MRVSAPGVLRKWILIMLTSLQAKERPSEYSDSNRSLLVNEPPSTRMLSSTFPLQNGENQPIAWTIQMYVKIRKNIVSWMPTLRQRNS
jgi:hypothetical protein